MDITGLWNDLSYFDGIIFSVWIGILYVGKSYIDDYFWHKKDK